MTYSVLGRLHRAPEQQWWWRPSDYSPTFVTHPTIRVIGAYVVRLAGVHCWTCVLKLEA